METDVDKTPHTEALVASSLSEWVYQQVKQKIIFFEYEPEQFLTETMLAAEFQVSKMPVKLAIRQLEKEGWLVADFRRKTRVKGITEQDVRNIYEFRSLIEHHALELIFQKQLAQVYAERFAAQLANVKAQHDDLRSHLLSERALHAELVSVYGNERISNVYGTLQDEVNRISCLIYINQGANHGIGYMDRAGNSWQRLIEHLRLKEYEPAKRQLLEHLELGQANALQGLQKWRQTQLAPKAKKSPRPKPEPIPKKQPSHGQPAPRCGNGR